MKALNKLHCHRTAALGAAVFLWLLGCSQNSAVPPEAGPEPTPAIDIALELDCERELAYLDALIARRAEDAGFPQATLIEVRELRRTAAELYLMREFVLALEFIGEAVALLGKL